MRKGILVSTRWLGVILLGAAGLLVTAPGCVLGQRGNLSAAILEEVSKLNDEGLRLSRERYFDASILVFERLLVICEKELGPEHPDLANALNNLAVPYREKGDYARAESLLQRSLAILEKALGKKHPRVATALNNLAVLYHEKGDYARSESLLRRSLGIFAQAYLEALKNRKPVDYSSIEVVTETSADGGTQGEPIKIRFQSSSKETLGLEKLNVANSLKNLAVIYIEKGDYARSESFLQRSLNILEKALGPEHPKVATSLYILADLYEKKGDYVRAELLLRKSQDIWEKALGPEHPSVATLLDRLGGLYEKKGDYAQAEALYLRSLIMLKKTLGPEHPDVASSLAHVAAFYEKKGHYTRAETLHQQSLAILIKVLGPEHPKVATSLYNLAELHRGKGNYARAELLYQQSLVILGKAFGPEHPKVATSLDSLALVYTEKGEYTRAERLYQRSLVIREKGLGLNHPAVASSLYNLALLCNMQGNYTRADSLSKRSLEILEKALGPEHPDMAMSIHNRARLFLDRGNYARAEPLLQRSSDMFGKSLGPDHPKMATVLNSLATIYQAKGDYSRAEPLYKRALTIVEKVLGAEHLDVGRSLNNLANLYGDQHDHARAEPLYQRALTMYEKALGPEHPNTATPIANLATLYKGKRDYKRAEPLYQRALTIYEKALGPEHPNTATLLNNFALLYQAEGDYTRAESFHQRSLAIKKKVLGPDHPAVAVSLHNLAMVHLASNDISSALKLMTHQAEIQEINATRELAVGSDEQRRAYINARGGPTDEAISLHLRFAPNSDAARELALTEILRRKGRVVDAMADSFALLRRRLNAADRLQLDAWQAITARHSALALRGVGNEPLAQYQKALKDLNEERQVIESNLTFQNVEVQAALKPVTLKPVWAALPQAASLVELFRYKPLEQESASMEYTFGKPRYVAYLLHHSDEIAWVDLGEAEPIEAAAAEFLSALRRPAADTGRPARKLDALVMQPIRRLLGDTRFVLLSPDGALNLVPFAALVDEEGHYLVERYTFTYLTSGRELVRLAATARSRQAPFIAAAPSFGEMVSPTPPSGGTGLNPSVTSIARDREGDRNQRSADLLDRVFGPLPGAANEGHAIYQRLMSARLVLGEDATEDAIKALHGPNIVHIATHGFFLPDQKPIADISANNSIYAKMDSNYSDRSYSKFESSLLRSGLAFAGANQRRSGASDGILTALEASQLDLIGTKLVVLSACETGVGDAVGGEGVYGLRRSLAIAGSETQVMSLWKVDDRATRELMEAYYDALLVGGGRSEAMRQAQLGLLNNPDRASPYYWASFIVSGNPAALDQHSVIPDVAQVKPGLRGCRCDIAAARSDHSEMWVLIVPGLILARKRSRPARAIPALCSRLVRGRRHRTYSAEATEQ